MGTTVFNEYFDCGEDHAKDGGPVSCNGHLLRVEWARSSDRYRIMVDNAMINMTDSLFVELRRMMNEVDQ